MVLQNVSSPPLPDPLPSGEGTIRIAVISFPGTNCEVESLRAIRRNGMEGISFRWNEDISKLKDAAPRSDASASTIGGYFLPGGFSYEDRGRSGMIAAHDPLLNFLRGEAAKGKVIIGHCNGAQILVESGLIPLDRGLKMALAKNIVSNFDIRISNFLNRWVWIKPTCAKGRCAVSDWEAPNQSVEGATAHDISASGTGVNVMHLPIAHGEGGFTTRDKDVIKELQKNDQIAFRYCDQEGNISEEYPITPNGSMNAIAGICNPAGNVIALMPHPERTPNGDPYFQSMKRWIDVVPSPGGGGLGRGDRRLYGITKLHVDPLPLTRTPSLEGGNLEIFIDTVITNNEEHSLEQLLKRYLPNIQLKQYRYVLCKDPKEFLSHISHYNPNKEVAHVGREAVDLNGVCLVRFDAEDACEGTCYVCNGINEGDVKKQEIQEIFANPHASVLSRLH